MEKKDEQHGDPQDGRHDVEGLVDQQDGRHELLEERGGQDGLFQEDGARGLQSDHNQDKDNSVTSKRVSTLNSKSFLFHLQKWVKELNKTFGHVGNISHVIKRLIADKAPTSVVRQEHRNFADQLEKFLGYKERLTNLVERAGATVEDDDFMEHQKCLDKANEQELVMIANKLQFEDYFQNQSMLHVPKAKSRHSQSTRSSKSTTLSLMQNKLKNIEMKADLKAKEKALLLDKEFKAKEADLQYLRDMEQIKIENEKVEAKMQAQEELEREIGSQGSLTSDEDLNDQFPKKVYDSRKYQVQQNPLTQVDHNTGGSKPGWFHSTPKRYGDHNPTMPLSSSNETGIQLLINEMRKPNVEIKSFKGDPMEYNAFIRQFENKVTQYCKQDSECFAFLEQYTEGEANTLVKMFANLDPRIGYKSALNELAQKYGNNDSIAHAYVRKALDWPTIKVNDVKALDEFSIFLKQCKYAMCSIEAVKILENPENMRKLVMKLPHFMHDKWRSFVSKKGNYSTKISFDELAQFVETESIKANHPIYGKAYMVEERSTVTKQAKQGPKKVFATTKVESESKVSKEEDRPNDNTGSKSKVGAKLGTNVQRQCLQCKGDHRLAHCKKFESLEHVKKLEIIKDKKLCFKCLRGNHFTTDCQRKENCKKCQKEHPTVLHMQYSNNTNKVEEPKVEEEPKDKEVAKVEEVSVNALAINKEELSTLAIIPVKVSVKGSHKVIETLAFLDPGSTATFCSESLMNKLNCTGRKVKYKVETLVGNQEVTSWVIKDLQISNLMDDEPIDLSNVYTKDSINISKELMPTQDDIKKWPHLKDIAIPQVHADSQVEMLIGNNNPEVYKPLDTMTGQEYTPHATKYKIGWVVWGLIREHGNNKLSVNKVSVEAMDKIDLLVRESINMDFPEKLVDDKKEYSIQDKLFMKKTNESIQWKDGNYEISLPFQSENIKIPNNVAYVRKRLNSLKDKLNKNVEFKNDYIKFMTKLLDQGFVEQVLDKDVNKNDGYVWYIPHHGVRHPRKHKLRVVFDCSSKYLGISLNDMLLQGPNMINNLQHVLLRFRQEPVAFMGDVQNMFYQVKVPVKQRDFVRFFWWPGGNVNMEPKVYRMTVHLFGAVSSPACANVALRQVVLDNQGSYNDKILKCITQHMYVDDCLVSTPTPQEAIDLIAGIKDLCNKGGFHLKDWVSNSKDVMESIPEQDRAQVYEQNLDIHSEVNRALGIVWSVINDTFEFKVNIDEAVINRRGILRIVSSLYDPLGLVAVFTLPVKVILRRLCQLKLGWDDDIPEKEKKEFMRWLESISLLQNIKVPRCIKKLSPYNAKAQLHCFADASENGYGVAIYVRFEYSDNSIHCSLLIGKSRVAPLKKITIPKLELTAATLAARMAYTVLKELDIQIESKYFWTDSTAVLQSIANEITCYRTFVANRLNIIHEASSVREWHYVESKQNPADLASRGIYANCEEGKVSKWFKGPIFLSKPMSEWPDSHRFVCNKMYEENDWLKDEAVHKVQTTIVKDESIISKLIEKYSSWTKLKRVVGRIILAIKKFKCKHMNVSSDLSKEILDEAEKNDCTE